MADIASAKLWVALALCLWPHVAGGPMPQQNFAERIIKHISDSGCDDVLNKPFFCDRWDETLLIQKAWQELFRSQIGAALTQNPVSVGNLCNIAVPKSRYTFRTVSHMSLLDTLKYTALVFSIGSCIEKQRLPKKVVFSNRFDAKRMKLDRSNYDGFRKESKRLSDSGKYRVKVITDIANYYDRLNLHKLENLLKEKGCDQTTVTKLNAVLTQWSQQQSFGIPVGSDASRLLAEAMLINADQELAAHRIKFVRYVDDYRIFCSSQERAYEAMQLLDQALRREGLFINSGKTRLIDLTLETEEHDEEKPEFDPIDVEEKIERTQLIRTRYASRIAKYYRYPGKEAIEKLRKLDMAALLAKVANPNSTEDALKQFVKAAIYAEKLDFSWLQKIIDLYPHLIPYVVDAIVKEHDRDASRLDSGFRKQAIAKFRAIFRVYARNDYFRIQACRLLCTLDRRCGEFLSKELLKLTHGGEVIFSQAVYFMEDRIPRARFLDMLARYSSYGFFARSSLAALLQRGCVIIGDERRAQMKNLGAGELDPFLTKLLRAI